LLSEPDWAEIYLNQLCENNDWLFICMQCELSEAFMEEFENCLDWITVSICQRMSVEFIRKYLHKLDLDYLLFHQCGMPWDLKREIECIIEQRKCDIYRNLYKN